FDLALCHRSRNRGVPCPSFHQLFHNSIELRFEAVCVEWRCAPLARDCESLERHSIFHAVSLQHEQRRSQALAAQVLSIHLRLLDAPTMRLARSKVAVALTEGKDSLR